MSAPLDLRDFPEWLRAEVAGAPPGETAVLAGHYAIFSSGAGPVDLLDGVAPPQNVPADFLEFTRLTWNEACSAVASARAKRARLIVLCDDIQYVRPALEDRGARERLAAALSSRYLQGVPMLPPFHHRVLSGHALGGGDVLQHSAERWLWSERELRHAAVERVRGSLKTNPAAGAMLVTNEDEGTIIVRVPEHGEVTLIHSGHTNCAGGWLELLAQVRGRGIRKLIALVPMRCLGPVTVGTTLAYRLCALDGLQVVTVAFADVSSQAPAAVVRGAA